jgi:hypothetical protein
MGIQQPSVFPQPLGGFHDDVAERCDVEMPLAVLILSGVDLGFILSYGKPSGGLTRSPRGSCAAMWSDTSLPTAAHLNVMLAATEPAWW